MRTLSLCLLSSVAFAVPASAAPLTFKPLIDARIRYENVDQAGIAREADAVTARVRAGYELSSGPFSFLAEAEGTLAISEKYNSGLNGKAAYPLVADPQNVELNRLQLQFKGVPKTVITAGRQRINLDDQRFVGAVGWRDNEQTFDAARVEWSGVKNLKLDVTYAWSVRTIWGIDGSLANNPPRPQAMGGDNVFANLAYTAKLGTLTGFYYRVEEDEPAAAMLRNSSQTFGGRFMGAYPLSKTVKLTYSASFANQSDIGANPISYSADYYLAEAGIEVKAFKLGIGYEVLGADGSVTTKTTSLPFAGGFAFQTPYATLHKFQGWADKFLVTPATGIKDLYGSAGYGWKKVGPFDAIGISAIYHDYKADRLGAHYGEEINLMLLAKVKKYSFTLKYADYNAKAFATDTRKIWASVEWAF
jgi:hypothetical protein